MRQEALKLIKNNNQLLTAMKDAIENGDKARQDQLVSRAEQLLMRKEKERLSNSAKEDRDMAIAGETIQDAAVGALQGATMEFADDILPESYGNLVDQAKERSPIAYQGGSIASSFLPGAALSKVAKGAMKLGSVTNALTTNAIETVGMREEGDSVADSALDFSFGAGAELGLLGGGRLLKSYGSKKSRLARKLNTLGVSTRDIAKNMDSMYGDPVEAVKKLEAAGIASFDSMKFDPRKMKFVRSSKGNKITRNSFLRGYKERLEEAQQSLGGELDLLVKGKSDNITKNQITSDPKFRERVEKVLSVNITAKEKESVLKHLDALMDSIGETSDVESLHNIKKVLQGRASQLYSRGSDLLPNEKMKQQLEASLAGYIRNKIGDLLPLQKSDRYKEINKFLSYTKTLDDDVARSFAKDIKGVQKGTYPTRAGVIDSAFDMLGFDAPGTVYNRGSGVGALTGQGIGLDGSELDPTLTRELIGSGVRGTGRKEAQAYREERPTATGEILRRPIGQPRREPQSLIPETLPENLERMKIPRSTEAIMENPTAFKAKVAQVRPELFPLVEEALNGGEGMSTAMRAISEAAPELFEQDKYSSFDGIVSSPRGKAIFYKDMKRALELKQMGTAEFVEVIDKLHNEEKVL